MPPRHAFRSAVSVIAFPTGSCALGVTPVSGEPAMRQSFAQVGVVLTNATQTLTTATLALVTLAMPARAPVLHPPVNTTSRPTSAARNASQLNAVSVTPSPLSAPGVTVAFGRVPISSEGGGANGTARSFQQSSAYRSSLRG